MLAPNIHIIGIQGSGKGTQASLLVKRYGLTYISSGNAFRQRASIADELGIQIQTEMRAGHLLSDDMLFKVVEHFLQTNSVPTGLLGDGVLRTFAQYQKLAELWTEFKLERPILIHLEADEETALERINKRKAEMLAALHSEEKKLFLGKLNYREDDNPAAITERFRLYHQLTEPLISSFRKDKVCYDFDARQSIEDIHSQITTLLEKLYPHLINVSH